MQKESRAERLHQWRAEEAERVIRKGLRLFLLCLLPALLLLFFFPASSRAASLPRKTPDEWLAYWQSDEFKNAQIVTDPSGYEGLTPAEHDWSDPDRVFEIDCVTATVYEDQTKANVLATAEVPIDGISVLVFNEVTLIEEQHENWIGAWNGGPILLNGNGYRISEGSGGMAAGTKVLVKETNGKLHAFRSGGVQGNALTVGEQLETRACIEAVHASDTTTVYDLGTLKLDYKNLSKGYDIHVAMPSKLTIDFDGDFTWADYGWHADIRKADFTLDITDLTSKVECDGGLQDKYSLQLVTIFEIPIVEGVVSLNLSPEIFVEFEGNSNVVADFSMMHGFACEAVVSLIIIPYNIEQHNDGPTAHMKSAEVEGSVYTGLEVGPKLEVLEGVLGLGLGYKGGIFTQGKIRSEEKSVSDFSWHGCENFECTEITSCPRLGPLSLDGIVARSSITLWEMIDPIDFDPFFKYYHSRTFDDSSTEYLCQHYGYRTDVHVVDQDGKAIKDATVSYSPYEEPFKAGAVDIKYSLLCRGYPLHIPASNPSKNPPDSSGNKVTITASCEYNGKTYTKSREYTRKLPRGSHVDIVLVEIDVGSKIFFDPNSDNLLTKDVRYMPETLVYRYSPGVQVNLPDNIPRVNGFAQYDFIGWNTKPDGSGEKYMAGDAIEGIDGDMTLYAQWTASHTENGFFLYYNANGGKNPPDSKGFLLDMEIQIDSKQPTWGKHVFKGWSFTADSTTINFEAGKTYTYEEVNPEKFQFVVLYAVWGYDPVISVRLDYDMNGGPVDQKPDSVWCKAGTYETVSDRKPHRMTEWEHLYEFAGWNTDKYAAYALFHPGQTIRMDSNMVLYAVWRLKSPPVTSRIAFKDTGSGTAQGMPRSIFFILEENTTINLPDNIPTKPGVLFIGWNTKADGSGTVYMPGTKISPTGDMTLYAQWRLLTDQYAIIYNPNGGTYAPSPQFAGMDEIAVLSGVPAVWEHHTFLGWSRDDSATQPEFPAGRTNRLTNTEGLPQIVLYAVWGYNPVVAVKLSYNMNGGPAGQKPADQWIDLGSWIQVSGRAPEWENHYFLGWSTDPNDTAGEYQPGAPIRLEQDMTLYAIWYMDPVVRPLWLSYDMNGGPEDQKPDDQWVVSGKTTQVSWAEPHWNDEYLFNGWSTDPDARYGEYAPGADIVLLEDTTLYAIWYYIPGGKQVTITYNLNGGLANRPDPQDVYAGLFFNLSTKKPAWDGQHTFLGWSTHPDNLSAMYAPGARVCFDRDTTLYAIWEAQYRITEGDGSAWTKGSKNGFRFVANGNMDYFWHLVIDGKTVPRSSYTLSSGSTVVELSQAFLDKLSPGLHTIRFAYYDGNADGTFTVKKRVPVTGDAANPLLYGSLVLLGLLGIGIGTAAFRRHGKKAGRR